MPKQTEYQDSTVRRALIMLAHGATSPEIAHATNIPETTIGHWRLKWKGEIEAIKTERKGSGVIAPPAYRRGYRWGEGGMY